MSTTTTETTRRYASCVRQMGRTPRNWEYIIWIGRKWRAFKEETGAPEHCGGLDAYQDVFDDWLEAQG